MAAWITTSHAAALLGTSVTTVRTMAQRGDIEYRTEPRPTRARWFISAPSVDDWLRLHGRVDARRSIRAGNVASAAKGPLAEELAQSKAARAALIDEVAALRSAALLLRARHAAVESADAHQRAVSRLLSEVVAEQQAATDQLRQALASADDALGEFLVDGPPTRPN